MPRGPKMVGGQPFPCQRAPHSDFPTLSSIQSDAFNTGWGAVSNGVDTRGTWTREETSLHIDCKRCLLDHYARHLCGWWLQKRIALRAEHIPGCVNTITDRESTAKLDSSDWHLNPEYFQLVITKLVQSTIDLFASRTNHQLPSFVITNPTPRQRRSIPWLNHGRDKWVTPPPFTL